MRDEASVQENSLEQLRREKVEFGQRVLGLDKTTAERAADRTVTAIEQTEAEEALAK